MASILVNSGQWNSLSEKEQQSIVEGLKQCGSLKDGDQIVPDDATPEIDIDNYQIELSWNPIKDICEGLCNTAATAAVTWCVANTGGMATAVCIAVAESARNECKKRC